MGLERFKRSPSHMEISKERKDRKKVCCCFLLLLLIFFFRTRSTQERANKGSVRVGGTYLLWNMMECLLSCFPWEAKCSYSHIPSSQQWPLKTAASVTAAETACVAPFGRNGLTLWPAMLMLLGKNTRRHAPFLSLWELSSTSCRYLLEKCLMGWVMEKT